MNLRIPEDVSVIGYDNISWQDAASAGLTTVSQPVREQAENSVRMLKSWYENGIEPEPQVIAGKLVERSSLASGSK